VSARCHRVRAMTKWRYTSRGCRLSRRHRRDRDGAQLSTSPRRLRVRSKIRRTINIETRFRRSSPKIAAAPAAAPCAEGYFRAPRRRARHRYSNGKGCRERLRPPEVVQCATPALMSPLSGAFGLRLDMQRARTVWPARRDGGKTFWIRTCGATTMTCAPWKPGRRRRAVWDGVKFPTIEKISPAAHAELVVTLYGFCAGRLEFPRVVVASRFAQADSTDGDDRHPSHAHRRISGLDLLTSRTVWTGWPTPSIGRVTRAIEDKLRTSCMSA